MKRKKGNLMIGVIAGVAALGIGYAAISNINLNINGSATAKASLNQEDFKVKFADFASTGDEITMLTDGGTTSNKNATLSNENKTATLTVEDTTATSSITGDLTATFNVTDIKEVGDKVVFEIPVVNNSTDIKAALTVNEPTNSNSEFFTVTAELKDDENEVLAQNGGSNTVVVTVEAIKIPKINDATGSFTISVEAAPQE